MVTGVDHTSSFWSGHPESDSALRARTFLQGSAHLAMLAKASRCYRRRHRSIADVASKGKPVRHALPLAVVFLSRLASAAGRVDDQGRRRTTSKANCSDVAQPVSCARK